MPSDSDLQLLSWPALGVPAGQVPALAAQRRRAGTGTVCVLDVVQADGQRLHWLDSAHARGWIEPSGQAGDEGRLPRWRAVFDAATARGFVGADAALLAAMATDGGEGQGAAVSALPRLSWSEAPHFAPPAARASRGPMGVYALVESAERLQAVLAAGVRTVQLRVKAPAGAGPAWQQALRPTLARVVALAKEAGAELFINDYWSLARELGAPGVHLGQEDLMALGDTGRDGLLASGVSLGVSSHSVWELCRARALSPRYIACGPVWATTTKDMPWLPQGLDNLAWWCRMAGAPVVAIGGILAPQQVRETAAAGADAVCIVRGLGADPAASVPPLLHAFEAGRQARGVPPADPGWPHASLPAAQED